MVLWVPLALLDQTVPLGLLVRWVLSARWVLWGRLIRSVPSAR